MHYIAYGICYQITFLLFTLLDTSVGDIEDSFRSFVARSDIAIVLINQNVLTSFNDSELIISLDC